MYIDETWMGLWFARFNQQYFRGQLPTPVLLMGRSRTMLGSFSFRRELRMGQRVSTRQTITLSRLYDLPEKEWQSVLLHEMIHYDLHHRGVKDTSPHGENFRNMMDRFNRDGWNIRVSHRGENAPRPDFSTQAPKLRLVALLQMRDGEQLISAVNPRYARRVYEQFRRFDRIRKVEWFVSSHPWVMALPLVRSPRAVAISANELENVMAYLQRVDSTTLTQMG